jgi:hypothetical protein
MKKRILGNLKGRSLTRAKRLVNAAFNNNKLSESITEPIELGSLYLYEQDFVKII